MKNLIKMSMAIIFITFNSLSLADEIDEVFAYTVSTDLQEITAIQTDNGLKYTLEGENFINDEGSPEIPFKIVNVALPSNTKIISIEASGSQIRSLAQGVDMAWFEGDIKTDIYEQYQPALKNEEVYSSNSLMPGKYAEIINSGYMGSQHLASLAVYPLQYRPFEGEVILVANIEIAINLTYQNIPNARGSNPGNLLLGGFVGNPEDLPADGPNVASGPGPLPGDIIMGIGAEYLVITSTELASAFYPFVFWKNQKGLLTELVLIEDILASYPGLDDAEKLREYLKDAHAAGAQWVLLGGDEDIIPIRYAYPGNVNNPPVLRYQQISDLYYADLTGDWDVDGDGIWGEYSHDAPDIYPEVYVGRVPAESVQDVEIWVGKAILYEQNPNNGDYSYLTKGLFIVADQMRDLNEHVALAELMPGNFLIDNSSCAEEPSGGSESPTQPTGEQVIETMNEGWGFISNLNHGGFYYYAAMTPGYNNNPRSDLFGDTLYFGDGTSALSHMTENNMYGIHYSISCYNAAYDFDKEVFWPGPFITNNSFMEAFLFLPNKGGVAYLGNTRWGWVSSSFQLEKKFIEYVFSDTARHLAVAEALSKIYYPTKRDIGYGHNVFGDPEMKIWAHPPEPLAVDVPADLAIDTNSFVVTVSASSGPAINKKVTIWKPGELYLRGYTDQSGHLEVPIALSEPGDMFVTAIGQDFLPDIDTIHVYLQSTAEDDNDGLPERTSLNANYPNPFNAYTQISFSLADPGQVTLEIFNINGRKVKTLIDDVIEAGEHSATWRGHNESGDVAASGAYFYRLKTENENIVRKMVLLK